MRYTRCFKHKFNKFSDVPVHTETNIFRLRGLIENVKNVLTLASLNVLIIQPLFLNKINLLGRVAEHYKECYFFEIHVGKILKE